MAATMGRDITIGDTIESLNGIDHFTVVRIKPDRPFLGATRARSMIADCGNGSMRELTIQDSGVYQVSANA